jgi:hypothetical protein
LENPAENLRYLRSLLKPKGWLCLILPQEPVYLVSDYAPDVNDHLYSWTPRTLANLLTRTGFGVHEIRREPNSGLLFFSSVADWSYSLYRLAMRTTDALRRVPGEWVAEASPR